MNPTITRQQSRPATQVPAQPMFRTIGRAGMPAMSLTTEQRGAIAVQPSSPSTAPAGWTGARWHDGAD